MRSHRSPEALCGSEDRYPGQLEPQRTCRYLPDPFHTPPPCFPCHRPGRRERGPGILQPSPFYIVAEEPTDVQRACATGTEGAQLSSAIGHRDAGMQREDNESRQCAQPPKGQQDESWVAHNTRIRVGGEGCHTPAALPHVRCPGEVEDGAAIVVTTSLAPLATHLTTAVSLVHAPGGRAGLISW